jgi:26S proteasome regulatory subunit N8
MNDMFKKVNAREKLIGWYHTGPKLRASDLEINELFKRYTPNPLLVIVDVQPKEVGVPTDAYFAVEEIKDVSPMRLPFPKFRISTRDTVWLANGFSIVNTNIPTLPRTAPQPPKPSSTPPR